MLPEAPQDIVFDSKIIGHDWNIRRGKRNRRRWPAFLASSQSPALNQLKSAAPLIRSIPGEALLVGDFLDVIHSHNAGPAPCPLQGLRGRYPLGGNKSLQSASHTQFLGQCPCIDA